MLRRIMRRGMRHAHSLLESEDPIFHKIYFLLCKDKMKDFYPELDMS